MNRGLHSDHARSIGLGGAQLWCGLRAVLTTRSLRFKCTVSYTISDGNDGLDRPECGTVRWNILVDFTEATESHTIATLANCGRACNGERYLCYTSYHRRRQRRPRRRRRRDANDQPYVFSGFDDGWQSTMATDGDQDGCRDNDEDDDDDNDGIVDTYDLCPESYGWVSTPSADYDYDGCHDADEDNDDDNDGVEDVDDRMSCGQEGDGSPIDTAIGTTTVAPIWMKTTTTTTTTT